MAQCPVLGALLEQPAQLAAGQGKEQAGSAQQDTLKTVLEAKNS